MWSGFITKSYKTWEKTRKYRITRPPLSDWNLAVGLFDGASQCKGSKWGGGAILKCLELGF